MNTDMKGTGEDTGEKSNDCWLSLHFKAVFFLVFSTSGFWGFLFLVCSGVTQAPTNSQHLIFTSIFSPDSEDIFCLFQRAHWVSRSCGTDGTTLRIALVNGQM